MAEPLYRRIAEELRTQIESGRLEPGQMLTELELRERYDASRNTVRDAVKWLTSRGLVEARTGQGTFVTRPIDPFVTLLSAEREDVRFKSEGLAGRRTPLDSSVRVEIQEADEEIAATLHLDPGSVVVSRQARRFIDDTPWSLQTSFYPIQLTELGASRLLGTRDIEEGALAYLKDVLGLQEMGYQDLIRIRPPDRTEGVFFGLPDDGRISVIAVLRTGYAQHGEPLRATIRIFPADRNQLLIRSGQVPVEATPVDG
jgi:GntR family transcriptional regulator